jgi:hypothetical protein
MIITTLLLPLRHIPFSSRDIDEAGLEKAQPGGAEKRADLHVREMEEEYRWIRDV